MFSNYLKSVKPACKKLLELLKPHFPYVSILGKQITGTSISVSAFNTSINDTMEKQCGFVVRLYDGKCYFDHSFSEISVEKVEEIAKDIIENAKVSKGLSSSHVDASPLPDEPLVKEFCRKSGGRPYSAEEIVGLFNGYKDEMHALSKLIVNATLHYENYEVSSFFLSPNRDLTQFYTWCNVACMAVARNETSMQMARSLCYGNNPEEALLGIKEKLKPTVDLAIELLDATLIEPGVYDIITAPSITGLIAHEAFGHGVEMDMFVKHRSKARRYIQKEVASPLVNMHDGAGATYSCASYFFDDDGELAHDTLIIKNGILQTGICDAVSASQLGTHSTGNGRRQDPSRKAYTRMTNTFFEAGKDKFEDMIASVKHGYMLFETSNGMEDPKNWNIQCTAQYGREIKDGKFTGKIVAPVVMSGYVPDLLKSISMVSDGFEVIGAGHCGKGYKEWVTVSDGGPCLKARCKLG